MPRKVNVAVPPAPASAHYSHSVASAGTDRVTLLKCRVATLEAKLDHLQASDPLDVSIPRPMKLLELEEKIRSTYAEIREVEAAGEPKPDPQTGYATDDLLVDPTMPLPNWDSPTQALDFSSVGSDSLTWIVEPLML